MTSRFPTRTSGPSSIASSIRRPAALGAAWAALSTFALSEPSFAQNAQPPVTELPEVTVTTTTTAKKKKAAKAAAPVAASQQAATPAASAPSAGAPAPGSRSGSLSVPTTAEATAEINRTPGAVEVVPGSAYQTSTPATTIKDALDYVPGVFVQPKWGDDSRLSIRGSGLSRNFHLRGVQLFMDGIPINTADGYGDFQEIDPTAYRYIEVFKGGNALRFGANSLGGAINFVMPTGYDSDLFGARIDVGSFGFRKAAVSSGGVSGAVDYFATVTAQETDGFRDHSDGESIRGSMNVGYRLSENVETRFYLNANNVDQRIPGSVTKSVALNSPETAAAGNLLNDYQRNIDTLRIANKTAIRIAPGTLVEVGAFNVDRHLMHPIFQWLDYRYDDYGAFARLSDESRIGGFANRLIAGVNLHNGNTDVRQYVNVRGQKGAQTVDAEDTSRNFSAYFENHFFVTPDVAVVAGTQFLHATRKREVEFGATPGETEFNLWSPKVGVLWDVTRNSQVFANVSRSAEVPSFGESVNVGPTVIPFYDIKAQRATTYEIGTRGANANFTWDLTAYRSEIKNELMCFYSAFGNCNVSNADRTVHQGLELGGGAAIAKGIIANGANPDTLWLHASYTFNDFFFDNDKDFGDNELPGAPRHYLRAELLYKHPSGVYFGPNIEWVPEAYYVDSANTLDTEAYAIWGAKIGFDNGGPITAYIEGRNLSDEAYIASASILDRANANSTLFEPGNGRAIYGGVQVKW
ncbi:TonB-dependent receptor domain-containing protein [Hyphomicrobium sp. LHD-15]|uniref:TonB-dependent receptor family protein n=1 Tax=Hyphomicrobium sp. LHD-15 TaxID=3072142 RepID=UPI0028101C09|nr:TonB-dependent receptor [Hyphomicrobium sp. LHD-15]MDQ8697432.1 TonB-dependent receptor [Hyphomicrobium sp. LHD-15]